MENCDDCVDFQKVVDGLEKDLEDSEQELLDLRETIADAIGARLL